MESSKNGVGFVHGVLMDFLPTLMSQAAPSHEEASQQGITEYLTFCSPHALLLASNLVKKAEKRTEPHVAVAVVAVVVASGSMCKKVKREDSPNWRTPIPQIPESLALAGGLAQEQS